MTPRSLTDPELLQAFTATRSPDTFRHLVDRHLPTVHAAATRILRHCRPPLTQHADDIAQSVFILLAQNAAKIPAHTPLIAWLYKVTHFACSNLQRIERNRSRHEQEAATMHFTTSAPPTLSDAEALLDPALLSLAEPDRTALLLRYTQDLSISEIAALTNVAPETAKKRLHRALTKLRKYFAAQGLLSAAPLALHALTPSPTPPTLAAVITATALTPINAAAATTSSYLIAKGVTHMMNLAKFAKAAAVFVALSLSLFSSVLIMRASDPPVTASTPADGVAAGAMGAAPPAATKEVSPFGPTVELVIHDAELVDLDSGKIVAQPDPSPGEWPSTEGVDLSYDRNSDDVGDAIVGYEMMAAQMSASNFDLDWRPINNVKSLLMVNQPARPLLSTAGGLHAYVIRTRGGNVGFLEIVSRQDPVGGAKAAVTIRYRFLLPAAGEQVLAEMVSQDALIPGSTFLGALQQDMTAALKAVEADRLSAARRAALRVQARMHWLDVMSRGTSFEKGVHQAARTAIRLLDLEDSDGPTIKQAVQEVQKALVAPSETIRKVGSKAL